MSKSPSELPHSSSFSAATFPQRILLVHNRYQWRGGEDVVVENEVTLLREHGHTVLEHIVDNRDILAAGTWQTLRALAHAAWSKVAYRTLREILARENPDLVHAHNFWFTLTPAIFAACRDAGVPVVLTLHNFRLLCPAGVLIHRRGHACTACVGKHPWRGVVNRCYHNSFLASAAVARMISLNRRRRTWETCVDRFLVPSEFSRALLVEGGLAAERIIVKPNFVRDLTLPDTVTPLPTEFNAESSQVVFVGRLSREKGLLTLLAAWREVEATNSDAQLLILGDGPLLAELQQLAKGLRVSFAGRVEEAGVHAAIHASTLLVLPSECYETFGRVVVEAYVLSRPVIVSRLGGAAELVRENKTGLLFAAGKVEELRLAILSLLGDREKCLRLGAAGREEYESFFTPEANYPLLLRAYAAAREAALR